MSAYDISHDAKQHMCAAQTTTMSYCVIPHDTCRFIEGGANLRNGFFKRNIVMPIDAVEQHRQAYGNIDVYLTAYQYDREKDYRKGLKYGSLYLDFDNKAISFSDPNLESNINAFEVVRQDVLTAIAYFQAMFDIKPDDVDLYFSGSKGIHLTIHPNILGIEPHEQLNEIFKAIVADIKLPNNTLDRGMYDAVRLWRMINSINSKSGLYKIPISYSELCSLSLPELADLARAPREPWSKDYRPTSRSRIMYRKYLLTVENKEQKQARRPYMGKRTPLREAPPCVTSLLTSVTAQGHRNNTAIVLASYFYQQNLSEEETLNRLLEWSSEYCSPSLEEKELATVVKSQYAKGYSYGCQTLQELAICNDDQCKLKPKQKLQTQTKQTSKVKLGSGKRRLMF